MTAGIALLVGCRELRPVIEAEGYKIEEADYFWGCDAEPLVWCAAVVSTSVGGGTGLPVASRLRALGITPVVLFRPGEREQVLVRFAGVQWRRGPVSPRFIDVFESSVRETRPLRFGDTTEVPVSRSMILRVDSCA